MDEPYGNEFVGFSRSQNTLNTVYLGRQVLDIEFLIERELCKRHAELWDLTTGDDVDDADMAELDELEPTIAATPAYTADGYAAKTRVVERAEFGRGEMIVINAILKADRKRIAA